ncbi:hypothetical protein GEMRC1_007517 [Eukaryota sp. GEM-RC1]
MSISCQLPEPVELVLSHCSCQKVKKRVVGERILAVTPTTLYVIKVSGTKQDLRQSLPLSSLITIASDSPQERLPETVHKEASKGLSGFGITVVCKDGYWNRVVLSTESQQTTFFHSLVTAYLKLIPPGGNRAVITGSVSLDEDILSIKNSPKDLPLNYGLSLSEGDQHFVNSSLPEPLDFIVASTFAEKTKHKAVGPRLLLLTTSSLYVVKANKDNRVLRQAIKFSSISKICADTPSDPLSPEVHEEASQGPLGLGLFLVTHDGYWNRLLFDASDHQTFVSRLIFCYKRIIPESYKGFADIREVYQEQKPLLRSMSSAGKPRTGSIHDTPVSKNRSASIAVSSQPLSEADFSFIDADIPEPRDCLQHVFCQKVRKHSEGERLLLLSPHRLYVVKINAKHHTLRQVHHLSTFTLIATDTLEMPVSNTLYKEASEGPLGFGLLLGKTDGYWLRVVMSPEDHEVFCGQLLTNYFNIVPQINRKAVIRGPVNSYKTNHADSAPFALKTALYSLLSDDDIRKWKAYDDQHLLNEVAEACLHQSGLSSRHLHPLPFSNSYVPLVDSMLSSLFLAASTFMSIDALDLDLDCHFDCYLPNELVATQMKKPSLNKQYKHMLLRALSSVFNCPHPPRMIKLRNFVFDDSETSLSWIPPSVPSPRHFERIQHFELNNIKLPHQGLAHLVVDLSASKNLNFLSLSNCNVGSVSHELLLSLGSPNLKPTLRFIDLSHNSFTQRQSQDLVGVFNLLAALEAIDLSYSNFDFAVLTAAMPALRNLKSLALNGIQVKRKRITPFAQSLARSTISSLGIADTGISETDALGLISHCVNNYQSRKKGSITLEFGGQGFSSSFLLFLESNLPVKLAGIPLSIRLHFPSSPVNLADMSAFCGSLSRLSLESLALTNLHPTKFLQNGQMNMSF